MRFLLLPVALAGCGASGGGPVESADLTSTTAAITASNTSRSTGVAPTGPPVSSGDEPMSWPPDCLGDSNLGIDPTCAVAMIGETAPSPCDDGPEQLGGNLFPYRHREQQATCCLLDGEPNDTWIRTPCE